MSKHGQICWEKGLYMLYYIKNKYDKIKNCSNFINLVILSCELNCNSNAKLPECQCLLTCQKAQTTDRTQQVSCFSLLEQDVKKLYILKNKASCQKSESLESL